MEPLVQPVPTVPSPQPVVANPTPPPAPVSSEKASFLYRFAAFVADQLLVSIVAFIVGFLLGLMGMSSNAAGFVGSFLYILYNILFVGFTGSTPGKKFFNLKITLVSGEKPGWGATLLRETIGRILSSVPLSLGYFWMLWDKDKQAWHDKIASTYVVQTSPIEGGKKVLAYLFAFLVPVIAVIGIIASIIIVMINPKAQIEKANQYKLEQDRLNQVKQEQLQQTQDYSYPTTTP